ncbi:TetR/AcrR family transcriptional regulator [Dyadobacter sp. NIV53]|uniref:TetR/AcrR family transcriptional regulator n=1 Tax=Dyadobacter sp. NIV53 TaxID=2861765 RepID=UPI001C88932D|nr:TetR/AcrR family transcriptional regulator [Dyadobacter sp. NIV53]
MATSKTEKTRAHIIATTASIFNKKGYAGTSITDLTKATKLTSGSIYGNFANKEEVALAAFDYNLASFRKVVQNEVDKCRTTKDRFFMYIKAYHSSADLKFPEGGCPMQNALTDADDTFEPLRKKAADGIMLWKNDLISIMNKGIAEGIFHAETKVEKTALHIIALSEFGFLMYSIGRNRKQSDEMLEIALEVAESIINKQ